MPSGLRRERDRERRKRTRKTLFDAAAKVFVQRGYHHCLISDIVAEAGVGQGTFYRNFSSKREIFGALMDRFVQRLMEAFGQMLENLPDDAAAYREGSILAIKRGAELVSENRDLTMLFLRDASAIDREFDEQKAQTLERFAAIARTYLDHAIQEGFARPCRSDIVAHALVGIGLRLVTLWVTDRVEGMTQEEMIEEVVVLAFEGFGCNADKR